MSDTARDTAAEPALVTKLIAEFIGTFVLVFGGAGAAAFAANFPNPEANTLGIGFLGVSLAFGLTVVAMAYAVGHISGGHFNPAVTLGAWAAKRLPARDVAAYIGTQLVAGALAGGAIFAVIDGKANGRPQETLAAVSNGFGAHSPGGFDWKAVLLVEVILTAIFLIVILGTTDNRAPKGFAPLAIGLTLTLIHLISIPVSNTSVNPARSLGTALWGGSVPLGQVWMFFLAPILGALIAGFAYHVLLGEKNIDNADQAAALEG